MFDVKGMLRAVGFFILAVAVVGLIFGGFFGFLFAK